LDDLREEYPEEEEHDPEEEAEDQETSLSFSLLRGYLIPLLSLSFNISFRLRMSIEVMAAPEEEDNIPSSLRASSNSLDTSSASSASAGCC
jgi:hypothetical protein